jgi:hypothetical protein
MHDTALTRPAVDHRHPRPTRALCAVVSLAVAWVSAPTAPVAAQHVEGWYVEVGVSRPVVTPVQDDFSIGGSTVTLSASPVTFPHVALGWLAGPLGFEASYRKLGVLRYLADDGSVEGDTHSNALEMTARIRLFERGRLRFDGAIGGQVVRTIAKTSRAPAAWPITGGVNTWRAVPVLGVGATVAIGGPWAVGVDYAPILRQLGTARESGRYRQQVVGIDVRRSW